MKAKKWTSYLLGVYIVLLVWVVLFKMAVSIDQLPALRNINLIPFYYDREVSFHLKEILYNLICFVPLGIYFRMLEIDSKKAFLLGFGLSFLFELSQFVFGIGATDITDLMMNTCGTFVGVLIYNILFQLCGSTKMLNQWFNILATISTFLLIGFMSIIILVN